MIVIKHIPGEDNETPRQQHLTSTWCNLLVMMSMWTWWMVQ
jgi:hypothetical protein